MNIFIIFLITCFVPYYLERYILQTTADEHDPPEFHLLHYRSHRHMVGDVCSRSLAAEEDPAEVDVVGQPPGCLRVVTGCGDGVLCREAVVV